MHFVRQWVAKIFFRAMSGEVFRMRDLHDVSRPLAGPSARRVREMRDGVVRGVSRTLRGKDFAAMAGTDAGAQRRAPQLTALIHNTFQQMVLCRSMSPNLVAKR